MKPLLKVENLRVWFPKETTFFGKPLTWVKAVDDVRFEDSAAVADSTSIRREATVSRNRFLCPRLSALLRFAEGYATDFRPQVSSEGREPGVSPVEAASG